MNKVTPEVIEMIESLSDSQFVEFFYRVTAKRDTSEFEGEKGHFVLADVSHFENEGWDIDFMALPEADGDWLPDSLICQSGQCSRCSTVVRGWVKRLVCPVCGEQVYGS